MARLTLKFKDSVLSDFELPPGGAVRIGRRRENDIVIDNLAVSGFHAKIESIGEQWVLIDLKSKNGCFVNEQLVNSHWLQDGDVISVGKHQLVFQDAGPAGTVQDLENEAPQTMIMETSQYRAMIRKSAPNYPSPFRRPKKLLCELVFLAGGEGRVRLKNKLIKIGRDDTADIQVKGLTVGRFAATISRRPDGYHLSYVGGMARPKINGEPVQRSAPLKDMDIIEVGPAKLQFTQRRISG